MSNRLMTKHVLTETVNIAARSGLTKTGYPEFGSNVVYAALVKDQTNLVKDSDGKEKTTTTKVYIDKSWNPAITSRITLSDGTIRDIVKINELKDRRNAVYMYVVFLD